MFLSLTERPTSFIPIISNHILDQKSKKSLTTNSTNHKSSSRTKLIDVRYHFVREFIEEGSGEDKICSFQRK